MMKQWTRVSKSDPCPICGAADWCAVCGGDYPVIKCMRVEEGSFSRHDDGSGEAYFHRPNGKDIERIRTAVKTDKKKERPGLSSGELREIYKASLEVDKKRLTILAAELGLPLKEMSLLDVGWLSRRQLKEYGTKCRTKGAYTFPMYNESGSLCGFRLRADGFKYSLAGGNNGFFVPRILLPWENITIVEGPTDVVAALAYGLYPIGRPNNTAFSRELAMMLASYSPGAIDIIIDNDEAGSKAQKNTYRGAEALVRALAVRCPVTPIRIARPSTVKDLRQAWMEGKTLRDEMKVIMTKNVSTQS